MKTRVSGVPYEVEFAPDFTNRDQLVRYYEDLITKIDNDRKQAVDYYENAIATLEQENKYLFARISRLEEECNWLESKTRETKQSTQGEH